MMAAPLWAQEAPAPATESADAATATDLSMGAEVGAADGPGSTYVAATFDAWEQRCVRAPEGQTDPCQLYQLLRDAEGTAVAEFSMFNLPAGGQAAAGATVIVPLETLLTENLQLAVDGGKTKVYPFTFCTSVGCIARVGFTAEEVDQFRKGAKAVLTIVPVVAPEQKVSVELSLKGFTAGFEAVSKTNP
jgi:invasion protein IalB